MSVKDCGNHVVKKDKTKEHLKKIGIGVGISVALVLLVFLIIWLVIRPVSKPVFVLEDATVQNFSLTSNFISSTFQLTVQCSNPNGRISIYYDRLIVYATYRTQQITVPTSLPPIYQDTNGMNVWSPFVTGVSVPIAPFVAGEISQDQTAGNMPINFRMDGRVRFRVGAYVSGSYTLHVNCPAYITVSNPNDGALVATHNVVKYQLSQTCSVSL